VDPAAAEPKHRQIYGALREAILNGHLRADEPLPSTRQLAQLLRVSRNTVLAAYEVLIGEGFLVSRGGAGTFVAHDAARAPLPPPQTFVEPRPLSSTADALRGRLLYPVSSVARPFHPSSPGIDVFPMEAWTRIIVRQTRVDRDRIMGEGGQQGYLPLRNQVALHLRLFRSCRCDADQVIITSGAHLGYFLSAMLLVDHDDSVWVEEPGYPDARLAFRTRTSRVIAVPVDEHGLDIETGRALSAQPRVIYVTPSHQWPLGGVMPVQRRLALLDFAASRGAWIVEDDYDGDLRFDGQSYAGLQGLDKAQRVIHVGTFSKTIYPGLRLGYVVVPPDLVSAFVAGRTAIDRYPNTLAQCVMAEFMEKGLYAKHLHKMRAVYQERHALLRARLESKLAGALLVKPATVGTFTVTELTNGLDDVGVVQALAAAGVEADPLSISSRGSERKHGLLLGHAIAGPEQIRHGVDIIERVICGMTRGAS
jgi:GntR family transcriptional regulator/MocR family aminotransferase